MNPKDSAELERRISTAHLNAKIGCVCDGKLSWNQSTDLPHWFTRWKETDGYVSRPRAGERYTVDPVNHVTKIHFVIELQLHHAGGFHPILMPTGAWYFDTKEERDKIFTALTTTTLACDEDESLIQQCIDIVRGENKGSVSLLQRRLRLAYTRARRLLDELERRGIVSAPADHTTTERNVLPATGISSAVEKENQK